MFFLYKCLRCLIIHVGLVVEGGLAILYGMVWPHCEAKPTTLKRPSPGDSFENHMHSIELGVA